MGIKVFVGLVSNVEQDIQDRSKLFGMGQL